MHTLNHPSINSGIPHETGTCSWNYGKVKTPAFVARFWKREDAVFHKDTELGPDVEIAPHV